MHHYHLLQEKMNRHPVGAPASEHYLEILKLLFPAGDIELAAKVAQHKAEVRKATE